RRVQRRKEPMRVGILKPDHIGDLILSAPAIAALRRHFEDLVLLCHPQTVALGRHLFPGLAIQPILFAHLDRTRSLGMDVRPLTETRGCSESPSPPYSGERGWGEGARISRGLHCPAPRRVPPPVLGAVRGGRTAQ